MASSLSSWSTPQEVLIVGAGVIGLSTATLLQAQNSKLDITLIASEFPTVSPMLRSPSDSSPSASVSYASMWAGAHYRPIPFIPATHSAFAFFSPEKRAFHLQLARERRWAMVTANHMKNLARSKPEVGVQIVLAEEYLEDPPLENLLLRSGDVYASADDQFHVFETQELKRLNEGKAGKALNGSDDVRKLVKWACSYETYVVNVHMYCAYLLQQFSQRGGRTVTQRVATFGDVLSLSRHNPTPLVVDCSGIGFPSDPMKNLIRGQTALVRNQYPRTLTRQCRDGTWSFLIPRPRGGGTIVGGTKQVGDEHGEPRPEERRVLLENAAKYFPDFVSAVEDFEVICDNVGMRPGRRGGMRIEVEDIATNQRKSVKVVHGYGAGGRGYEISWGVAEELSNLVEACLGEGSCNRTQQRGRL